MTRVVLLTMLLLVLATAALADGYPQLIKIDHKGRYSNVKQSIIWKDTDQDKELPLHFRAANCPKSIRLGVDHPNGTKIDARFPGWFVQLPLKLDQDFNAFDEFGGLKSGYFIQVAEFDIDSDGQPEILVLFGNGLIDLYVNVFKYHPPQKSKDVQREENWEVIGSFTGQEYLLVSKQTIQIPYGSQGLYSEYCWVKGKFVQTQ